MPGWGDRVNPHKSPALVTLLVRPHKSASIARADAARPIPEGRPNSLSLVPQHLPSPKLFPVLPHYREQEAQPDAGRARLKALIKQMPTPLVNRLPVLSAQHTQDAAFAAFRLNK